MGAFKLGNMTFGSLFKKPETVLYPLESKPQPLGLKGLIAIDVNGCILCGMCDRSCPTDCITVNKAEGFWEIDRFACIQCGYCVTVCPKDCLEMRPDYAKPNMEHKALRFGVPKQPARAAKEPAAGGKGAAQVESAAQVAGRKAEPPVRAAEDVQLAALIRMLDPHKAARVREALSKRAE